MDKTLLTKLIGKHISVIIQGTPHPSSGYLTDVGEDYITLKQDSGNTIIIVTSQIASILVANGRTKKNDNRE
jgi:hypothetical protein